MGEAEGRRHKSCTIEGWQSSEAVAEDERCRHGQQLLGGQAVAGNRAPVEDDRRLQDSRVAGVGQNGRASARGTNDHGPLSVFAARRAAMAAVLGSSSDRRAGPAARADSRLSKPVGARHDGSSKSRYINPYHVHMRYLIWQISKTRP